MGNLSFDANARRGVSRSDGMFLTVTLILAVVLPPIGLIVAVACGVAERRHGDHRKASQFFIVATIALVMLAIITLAGLGVHTGSSGGVAPH
jgi:TRAP-type C4-dicarboxylate transport system permease large subunit